MNQFSTLWIDIQSVCGSSISYLLRLSGYKGKHLDACGMEARRGLDTYDLCTFFRTSIDAIKYHSQNLNKKGATRAGK